MADETTSYKWAKTKNGIGSVAIVSIDVIPSAGDKNSIIEQYIGKGFTSQGYLEDVPAVGYNAWKIGARKGLEYAFSLTQRNWTVYINKIEGLSFTDTNPTIVGYTILRAFCDKIDLRLNENELEKLEQFVFNSWTKPYKELVPDFFSLTFTEHKD